ncbi:MAG: hypothetical protein ACRCTL_05320 [Pseudomonas sp.]
MQLGFSATPAVLDLLAIIQRTEDLRFSPDYRRLALTSISRDQIFVFDIEILHTSAGKQIHLSAGAFLVSSHLQYPHGLDFLDNETLAVANRDGDLCLFHLPADIRNGDELPLIQRFSTEKWAMQGPGSVVVSRLSPSQYELLVCRTIGHQVSRHLIDAEQGYAITEEHMLVDKWLEMPDGISISRNRRWLAVSSHSTQSGLLYANDSSLNTEADPVAVLRGATYPHGLRISDDDRYVLMTDAGAPYVHVYAQTDGHWQGIYDPCISLQVMDDEVFRRGSDGNPQEGGPKGLDIQAAHGILVTTCAAQPLAFFDLDALLAKAYSTGPIPVAASTATALEVQLELERQQRVAQTFINAIFRERQAAEHAARADSTQIQLWHAQDLLADTQAQLAYAQERLRLIHSSRSWRITAPLRWLTSRLERRTLKQPAQ